MPADYDQISREHRTGYGTFDHHIDAYEDFYSDDLHFLYELLQNAQDAISCDPEKHKKHGSLRLILRNDELLAINDGALFSEQNVRAICSIRQSTKDLTQVGTHGIGFKATGKFADLPEIYSGDERFRIRRKVEPEPIDSITDEMAKLVDEGFTICRLPFKQNLREGSVAALGERLRHIHKWSLLFLHDLRAVEWIDERNERQEGRYERHVEAHPTIRYANVVTLRSSLDGTLQSEERFLCFNHSSTPPDWVIQELVSRSRDPRERERIERSRIHSQPVEVALKLDANGNVVPLVGEASVLFSFLPTSKDTGLRFLAQGHLKTTFARDNIRDVSEFGWNRWLISEIAALLPTILSNLKDAGMLTPAVICSLPIPKENVLDGEGKPPLLSPILAACVSALRERPLVPTEQETLCTYATQIFHPHNRELRSLVTEKELSEVTGINGAIWLHADLRWGEADEGDLLRAAGIREVIPSQVVDWLQTKDAAWFEARDDVWIAALYRYLASQPLRSERERLKPLPLARREDGTHIVAVEEALFFPPTGEEEVKLVAPLLSLLPLLRNSLPATGTDASGDGVKGFLTEVGVRPLNLLVLLREWFFPAYKENCDQFTHEQNHSHVRFVVEALTRLPHNDAAELSKLARDVPFLLCYQGVERRVHKYEAPQAVYLPSIYTQSADLETYFGNGADVWFVDTGYLSSDGTKEGVNRSPEVTASEDDKYRQGWLKALNGFGVATVPRRRQIANATLAEEYKEKLRGGSGAVLDRSIDDYTLDGLDNAFERISKKSDLALPTSLALWRLLTRLRAAWRQQQNLFAIGVYRWFHRHEYDRKFESSLDTKLRTFQWVLSDDGEFRAPHELYMPASETRRILGDRARFLHPDLGVKEDQRGVPTRVLAETLKVRATVDIPAALEHLEYLSHLAPDVKAVEEVYAALQRRNMQSVEHRALFTSKPLLYTPTPKPRWWTAGETFWNDESNAFESSRGYLEEHYPASLKPFFTSVGVAASASFSDYTRAILALSGEDARDETVRNRAHALYTRLWAKLGEPVAPQPNNTSNSTTERNELWRQLLGSGCWLGYTGKGDWGWHERSELFLNDHDYNTALFASHLPFWTFSDLSDLARFAEITPSSQARIDFSSDGNDTVEQELPYWTQKVRGIRSQITTFLTSARLVGEHFEPRPIDFLAVLHVVRVSEAKTTYTLGGITVVDPKPLTSFLVVGEDQATATQAATVYVTAHASSAEVPDLIGDALSLHLRAGQIGGFVSRMLSAQDQGRVLDHWQRLGLRYVIPPYSNEDSSADQASEFFQNTEADEQGISTQGVSAIGMPLADAPVAFPTSATIRVETVNPPTEEASIQSLGSVDRLNVQDNFRFPAFGSQSESGQRGISAQTVTTGGSSVRSFRNAGYGTYGTGGGGEGQTHKALKSVVRDNPALVGTGLVFVREEYQIASGLAGSEVDVLLKDAKGKPVCVECKPYIPPGDYRPIWQAIRYKHLLAVEYGLSCGEVRAVIVVPYLPPDVQAKCTLMGVEFREVSVSLAAI